MSDDTVLITGCSSGIGRATAEAFLEDDWTVYATSRDERDLTELAARGCETASLDVTDREQVDALVDDIGARTGGVDCLVNNAGYGQFGPLEDVPDELLQHQFDVNVFGPHRLIRAVLPNMRRRNEGTIINISSVYGRVTSPGAGAYAASKFALEALSDTLRNEVDSLGIDVVVVAPGPVETNFNDRVEREANDLERTREYAWLYDLLDDYHATTRSLSLASSPEAVATVVRDVACMSDPAPRYPVGTFAKYATATRYLPDGVRDLCFRLLRRFA